ncbi:MAG TPA: RND family transporter [Gammaproteobacteria bacterium]|nr:RND family transporter [Gammaproteobacteria bacterium]
MILRSDQNIITAYAHWIIRWRWLVLVLCFLVVAVAAYGLRNFQFSADYKAYFGPDNPELIAFQAFENTYTKSENIIFVLQPADKNVFSRQTLEIVRQLTKDAWQIPYSIRVDSITNFQHTTANGDDLAVADLVDQTADLTDRQLTEIKKVALSEPALVKRLIADNGSTTGVAVTLQFPGNDQTRQLPEAVAYAEMMVKNLRASHPDLTVALTGVAVFSVAEIQVSESDSFTLVPVMYGLMIVLLLVFLRSLSGTVATLVVVSLSVLTAVGLMAWSGIKMNASTALAPIIILTLGIADSVHILLTLFQEMRAGRSKHDALVESLRLDTEPVFLTSLTTAIGFLSLNFSDSPPFHELGNITATGVVAAWVFSMTALPAMMAILPLRIKAQTGQRRLAMDRFGDFVIKRRKPLLWSMLALTASSLAFIPHLQLDDRFVQWFDRSIPFRVDTDFATANLTGPYTLEFSLDSGEAGGIAEPAYQKRLESFAVWLRTQPEVTHVNVFTDVMKRLNRSMHGDNPDWYRLPEQRDLAAQYLLLYEMYLPYGLDLNSQINLDKSASRLTVTLDTISQKRIITIIDRSEAWLKANMPPVMQAKATGTIVMFVHLAIRNIIGMLGGTALAFLLISMMLIFALRSLRLGLISLIPNIVPVLITFGLWAAFVHDIGIIASMITATSMGLIVDDTVHILSKYNRARREQGLSTEDAIRFSYSHVGKALWVTTLTLVAGFLVLSFSSFKLNVDMGILTATAISIALVMDFLLLPPLLLLMDRKKP